MADDFSAVLVDAVTEVLEKHAVIYHATHEGCRYRCAACEGPWVEVGDHPHAQVIHRAHQAQMVVARLAPEQVSAYEAADVFTGEPWLIGRKPTTPLFSLGVLSPEAQR